MVILKSIKMMIHSHSKQPRKTITVVPVFGDTVTTTNLQNSSKLLRRKIVSLLSI